MRANLISIAVTGAGTWLAVFDIDGAVYPFEIDGTDDESPTARLVTEAVDRERDEEEKSLGQVVRVVCEVLEASGLFAGIRFDSEIRDQSETEAVSDESEEAALVPSAPPESEEQVRPTHELTREDVTSSLGQPAAPLALPQSLREGFTRCPKCEVELKEGRLHSHLAERCPKSEEARAYKKAQRRILRQSPRRPIRPPPPVATGAPRRRCRGCGAVGTCYCG